MEHTVTVSRFTRGRGAIKGSGTLYGTEAGCSCRDWTARNNSCTPSQGGKSWAKSAHEAHLAKVTLERDIEIQRAQLERMARGLADAMADYTSERGIEYRMAEMNQKAESLLADLKAAGQA